MTRRLLRATLIGLIGLVALAAVWPVLSAAIGFKMEVLPGSKTSLSNTAAPESRACSQSGVTLVIDYGTQSTKPAKVSCVKGIDGSNATATSWDLLAAAGLKVQGTLQYPTGFVCRINGYPNKQQQDCLSTPTRRKGTWAYFVMAPDSKPVWRFAMQGAASRKPICGSVEGWVFSSSSHPLNHPRITPKPFVCGN